VREWKRCSRIQRPVPRLQARDRTRAGRWLGRVKRGGSLPQAAPPGARQTARLPRSTTRRNCHPCACTPPRLHVQPSVEQAIAAGPCSTQAGDNPVIGLWRPPRPPQLAVGAQHRFNHRPAANPGPIHRRSCGDWRPSLHPAPTSRSSKQPTRTCLPRSRGCDTDPPARPPSVTHVPGTKCQLRDRSMPADCSHPCKSPIRMAE
jgi:hypothetical protein